MWVRLWLYRDSSPRNQGGISTIKVRHAYQLMHASKNNSEIHDSTLMSMMRCRTCHA
jgi:hypothetical protein